MNLRQAQEQARRAVLAYLTHTASLPSGNLLSNLDMLARAQFLEGLVGHPWGTVANKASGAGVRGLTRAVSRMLLEVDPLVDPAASTWTYSSTLTYVCTFTYVPPAPLCMLYLQLRSCVRRRELRNFCPQYLHGTRWEDVTLYSLGGSAAVAGWWW